MTSQGSTGTSRAEVTLHRIEQTVRTPLADLGLDLEAVELTAAGKRRVLRVAVDADGGPTLDDIADAARTISAVLDAGDVMGELPYTLEVTSRGVDRPLTELRHWRRNVDRLIKLTLTDGESVVGRLKVVREGDVELTIPGGSGRLIAFEDISRALVQIEFNRPTDHEESDD